MKRFFTALFVLFLAFVTAGCGGGGGGGASADSGSRQSGRFITVENADYTTSSGITGKTGAGGAYDYRPGDTATFSTAGVKLGTVEAQETVDVFSFAKPALVSQILQALDSDMDDANGIQLQTAADGVPARTADARATDGMTTYKIDLTTADSSDPAYIRFIRENGLATKPLPEALAKAVIESLGVPLHRESNSYWRRIMRGETPAPSPLTIGTDPRIKSLYNDKSRMYRYRVKAAALYGLYLQVQQMHLNWSNNNLDEMEVSEKTAKKVLTGLTYALDTAFNYDTYYREGKPKKAVASQAESTYNAGTSLALSEEYGTAAALTGTVVFKCAPELFSSDPKAADCLVDTTATVLNELIQREYGEADPVAAEIYKGGVETGKNVANILRKCLKLPKEPSLKVFFTQRKECAEEATKDIVNGAAKAVAYAGLTAELANKNRDLNSFAIAVEIFMSRRYYAPGAGVLPYHELIPVFGGTQEEADDYDLKDVIFQLQKVSTLVSQSNRLNFLDLQLGVGGFDVHIVEDYLDMLEKMWGGDYGIYNIMRKKTASYFSKGGSVSEAAVQKDVDVLVAVETPYVTEWQSNDDGTASIRVCSTVHSWRTLADFTPSLSIVDEKTGIATVAVLDNDIRKSWKGSQIVCGWFHDYSAVGQAQEPADALFAVRADADFRFSVSDRRFHTGSYQVFDYTLKTLFTTLPKLGLSVESVPETAGTWRVIPTMSGAETPALYQWKIGGGSGCAASFIEYANRDFFNVALPDGCDPGTVSALTLTVEAWRQDFTKIAAASAPLDPAVVPAPDIFAAVPEYPVLYVTAAQKGKSGIKISGGKEPFSYTVTKAPGTAFSASVDAMGHVTVSTKNVDAKTLADSLAVQVADANGLTAEVMIGLVKPGNLSRGINLVKDEIKPYSYWPDTTHGCRSGETVHQTWGIVNESDKVLRNVVLKKDTAFCSAALHSPDRIVVGNLEPLVTTRVAADITPDRDANGPRYCQWKIYADIDGRQELLKWPESGRDAALHVYYTVDASDVAPPAVTNVHIREAADAVSGSFNIRQANDAVRNVRVDIAPKAYFPTVGTRSVAVGGDYDAVQAGGTKHFSIPLDGWSRDVVYWRISAENRDGVAMEPLPGMMKLSRYLPPKITGYSPKSAVVDQQTAFSVTGSGLPRTLAMSLEDADCLAPVVKEDGTKASVICTPGKTGKKRLYVAVEPHGEGVIGQENLIVNVVETAVPVLTYHSGPENVTAEKYFHIRLRLDDPDNDVKKITVDWGDGSTSVLEDPNAEETLHSFTHVYKNPGAYTFSAQAFDARGNRSNIVTGSIRVGQPETNDGGNTTGGGSVSTGQLPPKVSIYTLPYKTASSTLTVSWEQVPALSNDRARYEINVADNPAFYESQVYDAGEALRYLVPDLKDNTRYYFRVRAKNSSGTGPWSDTVSIAVDLQNTPQFNTAFQKPADRAVNVDIDPKFEWGVTDLDGDDLEYYIEIGTSVQNLVYHSGWISKKHLYWHEISTTKLAPGTTYYWRVKVRESGRDKAYYGGNYPSSPLWSFSTILRGPDLRIGQVSLLDPVRPNRQTRLKIHIRNSGTEAVDSFYARLRYKKNGTVNDFATQPMQFFDIPLAPGGGTDIILIADFRDEIIEKNGKSYDNILAEGVSYLVIDLPYSDDDINPLDNRQEYKITYTDQGEPQFDYLYVGHQSLYAENKVHGTLGSVLGGDSNGIEFSVKDDMQVTEAKIYYRLSQSDNWHLIQTFTSDKDHISGLVKWTIPEDQGYLTDSLQIRVTATDNSGNLSEIVSHSIAVYDNRLAVTVPTVSAHQVGEQFSLPLQIDHAYDIDLIEIKLIANGRSEILYSNIETSGFTPPTSVTLTLPSDNLYADAQAKLEIRVSDINGNEIKEAFTFDLKANLDAGDIFGNMITVYDKSYQDFPADSSMQRTDNYLKKVILDANGVAHLLVESVGWWKANGENDMSRHVRDFYMTYDYASKQLASPVLLFDIRQLNNGSMPPENFKDFIIAQDGTPIELTWNSETKTIRSHTASAHNSLVTASSGEQIDSIRALNHRGKTFVVYRSISQDGVKMVNALQIHPSVGTPHQVVSGYYGREMRLNNDIVYFPYKGKAFHVDDNLYSTGEAFDKGEQQIVVYGDVHSFNSQYLDIQFDTTHRLQLLSTSGETREIAQVEDDATLASYSDITKIDMTVTDESVLYTYSIQPDPNNSSRSLKILKIGLDGTMQKIATVGRFMGDDPRNSVAVNENALVAVANPDRGAAYLVIGDFSR